MAPAAAAPPRSSPAAFLANVGRSNAPTLQSVTQRLGAPDIIRQDGAGTAITYRLEHCALLMLFAADGANAMRLAEISPGPRRAGEAAPTLDQCVTEAQARPRAR